MTDVINEQIVKVSREIRELDERVRKGRQDIIVAVDPCNSGEALTHCNLDGALFALSELTGMQDAARTLLDTLRKLRAEA